MKKDSKITYDSVLATVACVKCGSTKVDVWYEGNGSGAVKRAKCGCCLWVWDIKNMGGRYCG